MKLLITGGAGFIGSNFIKHILSKYPEYRVINLDKLTYAGRLENLKEIESNPRYKFVKGDICDEKLVDELVGSQKPDAIINFAAESHVDRSISDPNAFLKTDIWGTHNLLEAARKHKISRIIHISTDEVYGSRKTGSFSENDPLSPSSPYSASKASADMLCNGYFITYGLPIIIVRPTNNFGPNQFPEKLIPLFATNLLEGKKVPVYGDGLQVRDWLYVIDNCEAIDLVLRKGKEGEVYNIGGGNEKTSLEITKFILAELKKDESHIEYVKDRPGHDRRYSLDCAKIRDEVGWQPSHKFEDALRATVAWYKENEEWWKQIKTGEYLEYYKKQYHS